METAWNILAIVVVLGVLVISELRRHRKVQLKLKETEELLSKTKSDFEDFVNLVNAHNSQVGRPRYFAPDVLRGEFPGVLDFNS